jgi:hypothetical protein
MSIMARPDLIDGESAPPKNQARRGRKNAKTVGIAYKDCCTKRAILRYWQNYEQLTQSRFFTAGFFLLVTAGKSQQFGEGIGQRAGTLNTVCATTGATS